MLEGFRLSPQQKRWWLLRQADPALPASAHMILRLDGALAPATLRQALEEVVQSHEILHTTFQFLPGVVIPLQVLEADPIANLAWGEVDLEGLAPTEQETRVAALQESAPPAPSTLEHGPLVRATLVRLAPERHLLHLTMPTLYADQSTLHNLAYELHAAYERAQQSGEREEEPIQYISMSEWLYELLDSEDAASGKEYWAKLTPTAPLSAALPVGHPGTGSGFARRTFSRPVAAELSAQVETLVARSDSTPAALYLAGWLLFLWRLTEQQSSTVGASFDGRAEEELKPVLGLFTRTLPIHAPLHPRMNFADLLAHVTTAMGDAQIWQDCFTWRQWAGADETGDAGSYLPFAYDFEAPLPSHPGSALTLSLLHADACADRFDLKLVISPAGEGIVTRLEYDGSRFDKGQAARLLEEFQTLLAAAVQNPAGQVTTFPLVGPVEREELLVEFNQTGLPAPTAACFHVLFAEQAARTPETLAAVYEEPATGQVSTLTYAELDEQANRLAHYLRTLGVGPDVLVGICFERSVEALVGLMGILKAGGGYLPLDAGYPAERLAFMLADSGTPLIVAQSQHKETLAPFGVPLFCPDEEGERLAQYPTDAPENWATPGNVAYAIYTSGSTGKPKGVLVEHAAPLTLLAGLEEAVYNWHSRPTRRVSLNAPLIFDASMQQLIMLLRGCTLEIIPQAVRLDGAAYVDYLRRHPVDALDCTPSLLQLLVRAGLLDDPTAAPDLILAAGEAIESPLWEELQRAPQTTAFNIYGPTECTVDATAYRIADGSPTPTIGRPLANYHLYILDPHLNPTPIGLAGELYIGGGGLARGYLKRPDLTAEKFVPDPFGGKEGARLYRTGDLARWRPDGRLEFLGRIDHQVKIRGYRIELGEIENALRAHPAIQDAVVTVRDDRGGDKRLVAYLVAAEGEDGHLTKALRPHLQATLPDYMVPADMVLLPALPLTASGKVDRQALPAPETVQGAGQESVAPPRSPIEEMLVGIWSSVLHIERLGIHDSFFDRGGHSLLAIQLVSRVRDAFGVEVPLNTLFNGPTVAELAQVIEQAQRERRGLVAPPLVSVPRDQTLPLSFAQQRLWFLQQVEPDSTMYNIPGALRLSGPLDVSAFEQAIAEMIRRHETLRTTFEMENEQPVQRIAPPAPWNLPGVDLRHLAPEEQEGELERLLTEETSHPFDLTKGPLLRVTLLQLGETEHILLFTMHHIITDGWSLGVIVQELGALYEAFASGQPAPLLPLPLQYADFAVWQRGWLQGEALESQIAYWTERLAGAPPLVSFPPDRARPAVQSFNGVTRKVTLPASLAEQLRALSRQEGVTLFMPLLAAFKVLLHHASGEQDVVVGTDVANRTRGELEGLIGFFVNQVVIRTDLSGDPTFRGLLTRVRDGALGAYTHQDLPFERLVEALNPERSRSYGPLFQTKIVLQNAPMPGLELPGLSLTSVAVDAGTAKFDLLLNLWESEEGLYCDFEYNRDLFDAATIERLIGHYALLLESVVAEPEARVSELRTRLSAADEAEQARRAQELQDARLQKFQRIKRKEQNPSSSTR